MKKMNKKFSFWIVAALLILMVFIREKQGIPFLAGYSNYLVTVDSVTTAGGSRDERQRIAHFHFSLGDSIYVNSFELEQEATVPEPGDLVKIRFQHKNPGNFRVVEMPPSK